MLRLAPVKAAFFLFFLPLFSTPSLAQIHSPSASSQASWTTISTTNDPTERHENGFIAYDGKLYLIGGRGVKPVQIFDPSTNSWTNGSSPPFQMHHFQAVLFNDLIYVVGAYTGACCDSESGLTNVWTYSPNTNQWVQRHEIPADRRRGSTGAVVYNDKIYIVGGIEGGHGTPATAYNWFDEYDPSSGQWKVLPNAPRVRDHFHAVLHNGKMYLTGGRDSSHPSVTQDTVDEIDVYNFVTGLWSTLPSSKDVPTPRGGTASVLYQGEILVIGGETAGQDLAHKATEVFDPISESWSTFSDLVVGRHGTQATVLNGAVYIAAGAAEKGGDPELNSIEKYEDGTIELVTRTQQMAPGWNLVGLPVAPTNAGYQSVYDDIDLESGIPPKTWNGSNGYDNFSTLSVGTAYWLKIEDNAPQGQNQVIAGAEVNALQVQLIEGWNMVSGPSCDNVILLGSSTSPAGAIPESSLYYFDEGYQPAFNGVFQRGRINEGLGYWVFASNPAILTLDCGGNKSFASQPARQPDQAADSFGSIIVSDGSGARQTLHFGGALGQAGDLDAFNLPPRIDGDYFDARYSNNKRLVESDQGYMKIQARQGPITLYYEAAPANRDGALMVAASSGNGLQNPKSLDVGHRITLEPQDAELVSIQFLAGRTHGLPEAFALSGNYPNPFNPTTRIAFDLPETADLSLKVFNLTGQLMLNQVLGTRQAGSNQSIEVQAQNWPAGSYLYRLTATMGTRVVTRSGRMVLLK